jgi:hypothetical protein
VAPESTPPAATSTPKPTPPPDGLALHIQIMEKPSWLQIRTDGVVVFTGTLAPGAERTFTAKREIYIHTGRADSVALELNGKSQGRLGEPGQTVVRKTFTLDSLADQAQGEEPAAAR